MTHFTNVCLVRPGWGSPFYFLSFATIREGSNVWMLTFFYRNKIVFCVSTHYKFRNLPLFIYKFVKRRQYSTDFFMKILTKRNFKQIFYSVKSLLNESSPSFLWGFTWHHFATFLASFVNGAKTHEINFSFFNPSKIKLMEFNMPEWCISNGLYVIFSNCIMVI